MKLAQIAKLASPPDWLCVGDGADGGNRTHTPNWEEDFKSSASTVPPRPLVQGTATVEPAVLFRGHFLEV